MKNSRLCEIIRKNLENQGIQISETEAEDIFASVSHNISEILDKGDIVDISDFGSFWRKKNERTIATFFKPNNDILERINKNE